MAWTSPLKGTLRHTERPSKQELEWNPTLPSNIVRTPDHYGPHPRQTTKRWWEASLSSLSRSASPAISINLPSTKYEFDHQDHLESLTPNTNQMTQRPLRNSESSTAQWVLASRELWHMPNKPMDVEFITRLAAIRRLTDGNSTSSSPPASLILGSPVSTRSSAFSQSFPFASESQPSASEFNPPTPVFTDAIPAGFMRELERLSVGRTLMIKAPALDDSYHPLQNSHTVIATQSLDTTYEVNSSSSTSSSPNSSPRQRSRRLPTPTKSVPYFKQTPKASALFILFYIFLIPFIVRWAVYTTRNINTLPKLGQ